MLVMNLELDNLFAFRDFSINFSYPKKIVNSTIESEFLQNKPNFRYKKVNIIMGANASGKTSLGIALMSIFNFMVRSNLELLYKRIRNKEKNAFFKIDFLPDEETLYRVECRIQGAKEIKLSDVKVNIDVYRVNIRKSDSYESCLKRLKKLEFDSNFNYRDKLEALPDFGWSFSLTNDTMQEVDIDVKRLDLKILEIVLQSLDSDILAVKTLDEVENSFVVHKEEDSIIIQNGKVVDDSKLSSGTKAGIQVAEIISAIKSHRHGFYYCDEKFSFIHSEIEKAFLSIMISELDENEQLFFTSHNMELLEMDLPKHSFTFLRKGQVIEAIYPEKYIKKNDVSLYNAVKNDVFNCTPSVDKIYQIEEIKYEE